MSWPTESLGNLLAPAGNVRAGDQILPVLSITMHAGLVDQSKKFKKRVASRDISGYRVVYTNELVVGFPIDEGVLGFQTKYAAAVVSPAYSIWKLRRPSDIYIPFMETYLRSGEARRIYSKKMRGAVARRRSISKEDFLGIEIPLPPFEEQRRIAAVLDKADALRRQRQDSLLLTEKLLQSVFIQLFGTEVDPRCPRVTLSEHLDFITSGGRGWAKYYSPDGEKFIRSLDVQMNEIDDSQMARVTPPNNAEADRTRIHTGDVLLTITGSLIGRVAPVNEPHAGAFISQHVAILRTHGFQPEFLSWAISMPEVQRQIQRTQRGQTKPGLNFEQIGTLTVPRPSEELEETFVKLIRKRQDIVVDQRRALVASNLFFASLQQRAFRGELDLSHLVLDSPDDAPVVLKWAEPTDIRDTQTAAALFNIPQAIEVALKELDTAVAKGESIAWSADYFRYRVLGIQATPFTFSDVLNKAESVFTELSYDEMKDMFLELLGYGGSSALLNQKFDLSIDEKTDEVTGRKEIVFEPTA